MNEKRQNGSAVEEAEAVDKKAQQVLVFKARFFDLLRAKDMADMEMKKLVQQINQLEKGT